MRRRRRMRGQALIEALCAMLLLVPLGVATFDLWQRQSVLQAAQAAAWTGAIAAHHRVDVGAFHDPAQGRGPSANAWSEDVSVSPTGQPAAAQAVEDGVFALLQPALTVGSGHLDLPRGQARRARASVGTAMPGLQRPDGAGSYTATAELAVMVGDWAADDAAAVRERIEALTTAGRIRAWRPILQPLTEPLRLLEPAVSRLCLGRIDPDILPADRLVGVPAGSSDLRSRPC